MTRGHKAKKHVPAHKHKEKPEHEGEKQHAAQHHEKKEELELKESVTALKNIFWNEKALIILLIIIAIFASAYFRMYTVNLPATENWAQDSYYNQIKANIEQQVQQLYPNLPAAQRQQFVDEQFSQQLKELRQSSGDQLDAQIKQTATYFKSQLQDENGHTYLLAIDPYLWYSQARNLEEYGMAGDELVDGKPSFSLRRGQEPKFENLKVHHYIIVGIHGVMQIFDNDTPLQRASFFMPVIIIGLAIIPAFFLGRKIGGNLGGFVAGLAIALNTALLGRTPAGFADTDAFIIFFPLLMSWLFIEALSAKKVSHQLILAGLAGLSFALFSHIWNQAWHIGSILLGVLGIVFLFNIFKDAKQFSSWKKITSTYSAQLVGIGLVILVSIFIFAGGINSLMNPHTSFMQTGTQKVEQIFAQPFSALGVKEVATADIWPNVLTTVAELNEGSWAQVLNSVGGKVFFSIAIIGILLSIFVTSKHAKSRVSYPALLLLWSFVLVTAGLMSSRFIALLAAPFALAFGSAFGILWEKSKDWIKTDTSLLRAGRIALIVLLVILFVGIPFTSAFDKLPVGKAHRIALNEVPSMNDGWYDSLITIKEDADDGIITSWWDFGHWFVNVAQRRVTFDGGDQGRRIYWVGRSLMIDNPEENKAILRMLNCGQNVGYERLVDYTNDSYLSTQLINTIIYEQKNDAREELLQAGLSSEEVNVVLEKTHCSDDQLLKQYYITSQDMVGKAGVWAHFGSWNFTKAFVYNTVKNKPYEEAIEIMQERLGMTEEEATVMYYDATSLATNREVDAWISPWPGYVTTSARNCITDNITIACTINQVIASGNNGQTVLEQAIIPINNPQGTTFAVGSYNAQGKVGNAVIRPQAVILEEEDEFETYELENVSFPYDIIIGESEKGLQAIVADPLLAGSSFTKLFFFDGAGMPGYEKLSDVTSFNGQRIIVYTVDLSNE